MFQSKEHESEIWTKPVVPEGSMAFVYLYTGDRGRLRPISSTLSALGLNSEQGYRITDVWDGKNMGEYMPSDTFTAQVPPSGVFFGKATPL